MVPNSDPRNIETGSVILAARYADQPYIVRTADGAWLCCLTSGSGHEGEPGQRVTTQRSSDCGRTWSAPLPVEPDDERENSYAVLLAAPSGRIFIFYNHNTDNLRAAIADDPPFKGGLCSRVDSLGYYVFKYSDDGGRSWSAKRYPIPVRETAIDRANPYGGRVRYFWNVGKPFILGGAAYVSLHKVGGLGEGFFTSSEGVLLRSPDLLTVSDPAAAAWETLPEGEFGLRTPAGGGPVAEEQSTVVLSDGSLMTVYRTIDGHPVCAYSRDGGRTYEPPRYMRYADGGLIKHPRAANFCWRCENGKYLYWFHNHGGRFIAEHPQRRNYAYIGRNPVWLCGGVEVPGAHGLEIAWSQPEIVLYADDPEERMSYPDLVEQDGAYYLTETQKTTARVHRVDNALLEGLWGQFDAPAPVSREGLLLELGGSQLAQACEVDAPALPDLRAGGGFTLNLRLNLARTTPGLVLLDTRDRQGIGWRLAAAEDGRLELTLNDGQTENRWRSEPGTLRPGEPLAAAVVVDGGPKVILFITDGVLQDGEEASQYGWGRFSPYLRTPNGAGRLRVADGVEALAVYGRALRVSEVVALHKG